MKALDRGRESIGAGRAEPSPAGAAFPRRSAGGRLLVLGGSGFLGVPLVEAALGNGDFERILLAARDPDAARLWPAALRDPRLERVAFDLGASPGTLRAELDRLAPDALVCLAAMADGGACERDPELAQRLNAEAPGELAAWCRRRGVRLLHTSTDLVHGALPPPPAGFPDEAPAAPISTYGRTKAAGEACVLEALPEALVVRLPLLFGPARGRARGASAALLAELRAGRPVTLFEDEQRQPLEVGLAARALLALLPLSLGGRLNLPGPEALSRADFGRRLLAATRAFGRPLPSPRFGRRADLGLEASRPADTRLDGRAAQALLGPFPPLARSLAEAAACA
jgi:dTDP-4-dehydrorhamnose reductase